MSAFLLDVNVLVALAWPGHQAHQKAQRWFARHSSKGWATCPMTQAGFVRIVSNRAFSPLAVTPAEAVRGLQISISDPHHQFWKDDLSLAEALSASQAKLFGHKQITDAYLLALAIHRKGTLATLDGGMRSLVGPRLLAQDYVELIA
jgi:toxin-antitoxin system PIN domain toxin